jgi:hypothetical protein
LQATCDPGWSDYLYLAEDLRSLAGRRYNGQRNHVNYFRRTYPGHRFEEMRPEDAPEVLAFYKQSGLAVSKDSAFFRAESGTVCETLENFEAYGLLGGVLRTQSSIAAFSLGEVVGDTLFVHIEKANPGHRGAYQVMVNEFVRRYAGPGVVYVNREEDCGDEGLRISKQSYHPCRMMHKYLVETG